MLICGMKLTHDGTVAVAEGSRLLFSVEAEKLGNNRRYQDLDRLETAEQILQERGCRPADIGVFVIDGWHGGADGRTAVVESSRAGQPVKLAVAPYHERSAAANTLERYTFAGLPIGGAEHAYASYHHATDHLFAAYATSPFAALGEPALVLVWDGGMLPMLYGVVPGSQQVTNYGPLFPLFGNAFAEFAGHFEPFREVYRQEIRKWDRRRPSEFAGKAMAYAALGTVQTSGFAVFDDVLDSADTVSIDTAVLLARTVQRRRSELFPGLSDADLIATFQGYLGKVLLDAFRARLPELNGGREPNLCLAGGCALNIKWNSALRASGLFADVWVPPFPNDSGSAIGAICSELARTGQPTLEWNVYQGPALLSPASLPGWRAEPAGPARIARLLHEIGEPVVALNGQAELGPRALGNRSILAPAVDARMKDRLNEIKGREDYRPVAPICLEAAAPRIFAPGTPDPYMLFDHEVRPAWRARIPAVMHLDGTARLQTVSAEANPLMAQVLTEYERLSGIPVLCNTSANHKGRGFFPDAASAMAWGKARYVWSGGVLYTWT